VKSEKLWMALLRNVFFFGRAPKVDPKPAERCTLRTERSYLKLSPSATPAFKIQNPTSIIPLMRHKRISGSGSA
jgi:hypothetical protein